MLSRLRPRVAGALRQIDGLVARIANASKNWLAWPVLYAITAGSGAWMLAHVRRLQEVDTNKVGLQDSVRMSLCVAGAMGALVLLYAAAVLLVWRRTRHWRISETASALNRRLRPLLALPVVVGLGLAGIEKDSPKLTFVYIALAAAAAGWGVYGWAKAPRIEPFVADTPDIEPEPTRARRALKKGGWALAVGALWAGYAVFFSRLSIINHHALNTRTIDLGYYDNIFYQSIHGRPLACTLIRGGYHGSAHFDPLLVLLSPLYLLYPRAELILILQAVWLGAGVVPMYLIARDRIGRALPAFLLALMYALYPALHGANLYEFHSLSLLSPVILWLIFFLERGSTRGYYLALIPALLLREDVPLLLCFVGLYAILSDRPGNTRKGWVTIVVGLVYFVIVKRFFMTSSEIFMVGKESLSFAYYYEDLIPNKNGVGGLVISLLTNPWFVVKHVFTEPKVLYFLTLFGPLVFLPFFARVGRVMLFYGMLFCFLATRTAVFSPHFQYSSVILPIAFALTPMALRQIEDAGLPSKLGLSAPRLSRALLGAALAASLLCSWKFGGLLPNQTFRGGFAGVARYLGPKEAETYAWVRAQADSIPLNESVGTTNRLGCHVSNRKEVFFYPYAAPNVDWVFIDEAELRGGDLDRHNKNVKDGKILEVSRYGKLALFKKKK